MNKTSTRFAIAIVVIGFLVAMFLLNAKEDRKTNDTSNDATICAQDVKTCPDGSFVSRTGPNCEFAECSEKKMESNAAIDTSGWKTYRNEEYGFEVRYPSKWGDYKFEAFEPDTENLGDDCKTSGSTLMLTLLWEESRYVYFSGRSVDFNDCVSARGGMLIDFVDFVLDEEENKINFISYLGEKESVDIIKRIQIDKAKFAYLFANHFCEGCTGKQTALIPLHSKNKNNKLIFLSASSDELYEILTHFKFTN